MDWVQAHLVINHFPIVLAIVAAAAALSSLAVPRAAAWSFVYATLFVGGMLAPLAFLTGTRAEEIVEEDWYVEEEVLEEHEEAGKRAAWILFAIGITAAAARSGERRFPQRARSLHVAITLIALGSAALAVQTGLLGGRIVHDNEELFAPGARLTAPAR